MGCRSWKAWGPTAGLGCKWKRESLEGFEPTALFRPSFNRTAWLPGGEQTGWQWGRGDGRQGAAATTQGRDAGGLASGEDGDNWMDSEDSLKVQPTGSADKVKVE